MIKQLFHFKRKASFFIHHAYWPGFADYCRIFSPGDLACTTIIFWLLNLLLPGLMDLMYKNWLPGSPGNTGPEGHSFFYVGFHYLFLGFLKLLGITSPQWVMLFVRIIHMLLSLLVISFGYRIASLISEKQTAYKAALLLAVFWFMPYLSVRNLVEMVSIPFLMYGTLIILRQELIRKGDEPGYHKTSFLVAGFFLGLAFSVRYQTLFLQVE